jgi:hypothetical protein
MTKDSRVSKIAFVGDYLPRKCGIATFTSDLLVAVANAHPQSQCFAVSVNDIKGGYEYPAAVHFEIEEQDLSSYLRAADFLNLSNVDIVCLQHEFGIFGGPAGGHILAFLRYRSGKCDRNGILFRVGFLSKLFERINLWNAHHSRH